MKKIILAASLFSVTLSFLTSCNSECNCGETCTCDQYCVCTKCKHNQDVENPVNPETPVTPTNPYGIPDDSQAGDAPSVDAPNTNIPNIQTEVTGSGTDAVLTINMTGVQDPLTYEWLTLAGTGQGDQNVWVTVDGKPKSIVVYNNDGNEGEAVLADLVFTVDNSGSMGEEADAIARDIMAWSQLLSQSGLNVKFGVVGYGDNQYGIDGGMNMDNIDVLNNFLSGRNVSGTYRTFGFYGYDANRLEGLALSSSNGYYNGSYNECGALAIRFADQQFNFRPGANRIYVNFTDEPNQPSGYEDFSVEFFKDQSNWPAAKGTVHTVYSDYQFTDNNWNAREQPWLISDYTGGTKLFTSSSFSGITLQSLPVTGAMQHSYIIRFTNIGEFMDGQPHEVTMTIYTPDGRVKAVKTFTVTFGQS